MIHAGVGNAQGCNELTQRGNVGLSHLGRALTGANDRLGNDLNERNARTVAIHQGRRGAVNTAVCTTEVGQLAGVFLHVGTLDFHAPLGAVFQHYVQVAVIGNRLVVLGNLVVLRLVRVKVILAGKAGGLRNGAIKRQANLDGALHALGVNYRQRTGQAQGDRVNVGIRRCVEVRRRGRKHLGFRIQLYVDFHAHYRFELF